MPMNTNNSNKQIFSLPEEELTDCEVLVMRVIWNSAEIMSIQEITSKINHTFHKDWKTQTVSTFLSRAVKKGYLEMKRNGRSFDYYPLVSEQEYGKREINKCVEIWSDGKLENLIASFSETNKLSEQEKMQIRRVINDMD
jgi:Predicted transcriptional regulator